MWEVFNPFNNTQLFVSEDENACYDYKTKQLEIDEFWKVSAYIIRPIKKEPIL